MHVIMNECKLFLFCHTVYTGQMPRDQSKVSLLSRCPDFIGQCTCEWAITKCPDSEGVPILSVLISRFHCRCASMHATVTAVIMSAYMPQLDLCIEIFRSLFIQSL